MLNGTVHTEPLAVPLVLGDGFWYDLGDDRWDDSQISAISMGAEETCIVLMNNSGDGCGCSCVRKWDRTHQLTPACVLLACDTLRTRCDTVPSVCSSQRPALAWRSGHQSLWRCLAAGAGSSLQLEKITRWECTGASIG